MQVVLQRRAGEEQAVGSSELAHDLRQLHT